MSDIIYGTNHLYDNVRVGIKAELDALVSEMATGYSPMLNTAHDTHFIAGPTLNAVSVDIVLANKEFRESGIKGSPSAVAVVYHVTASIRVHVATEHDSVDTEALWRLLNSVENWIESHRDLGGGFFGIDTSSHDTEGPIYFEESLTWGGEMKFIVRGSYDHIQL